MAPVAARLLALVLAAAPACSVVTPPPVLPAHEVAQPLAEGTTTVSLVGGIGGGLWIDSFYGLELRVARQVSPALQLGAGVGVGRNAERQRSEAEKLAAYRKCTDARAKQGDFPLFAIDCGSPEDTNHPRWLAALHLFGRYNPDLDRDEYAVTFGVGGGLGDAGLGWLTLDAGLRASSSGDTLAAVGGPTLGLAVPLRTRLAIDHGKRPRTTLVLAFGGGLVGYRDSALGASLDLTFVGLRSSDDGGALLLMTAGAEARDLAAE